MAGRKSIFWTLALVGVVAVSTAIWQNQVRHQRKAAAAAEARAQAKKHKSRDPDEEPVEKLRPPAPKKAPKVTVLGQAAKEHLAEQAFIAALRSVFLWRGTQPPGNPGTNRVLLEKLSAIAFEDLPSDRKSAWQSLLQSWKSLADPAKATDPQIKEKSHQAAETLNAMLKAHGDGDIVL